MAETAVCPADDAPSRRYQPGVDVSQGALGQRAIGRRRHGAGRPQHDRRDYNVFVLMGDGETNEGSVWEAAASAAKFGLGNLVGITIAPLSVDGKLEDIMPMEPMVDKWRTPAGTWCAWTGTTFRRCSRRWRRAGRGFLEGKPR